MQWRLQRTFRSNLVMQ
uniref:Uncharacterized protein n=1 Tax=Arundo donax TaxID=35708 RepID=A0A0A9HG37_ARUDO